MPKIWSWVFSSKIIENHSGPTCGPFIFPLWHGYGTLSVTKLKRYPRFLSDMRLVYIVVLLGFLSFLGLNTTKAQPAQTSLKGVVESLMTTDSDRLSAYFGDQLELVILGKTQVLSRTQAQYVMDRFFNKFPFSSFNTLHVGEASGTLYALGEYRSSGGTFEVNIFIKLTSGKVTELRFARKDG